MLINEDEYIVKAKNANMEIHKKTKTIEKMSIIFLILMSVIELWRYEIIENALGVGLVIILGIPLIFIFPEWDLIIKDRKIYIKKGYLKYNIDYENLINCKWKMSSGRNREHNLLEIEYIENNKFKTISLSYYPEMKFEILELCTNFITNKELKKYQNIKDDYLDIRDEELDEIIMKKKEKENKLKNIILIVAVIFFLMILSIPVWKK